MDEKLINKEEFTQNEENLTMNEEHEKNFCSNCGTELPYGQKFCGNCGKAFEEKKQYCPGCGKEVKEGLKYCSECGRKIDNSLTIFKGIHHKKSVVADFVRYHKKKFVVGGLVMGIILVIALVCNFLLPHIFVSTNELLSEGNYGKAYARAKSDEKKEVLIENVLAYVCKKEVVESFKDPDSFHLNKAWYRNDTIVLLTSGKNSLGGNTSSYIYITYDKDDKAYSVFGSVTDLEEEESSYWDDSEEKAEKAVDNLIRVAIKAVIKEESSEIKTDTVDRINDLFKANHLKGVELIEETEELHTDNDSVS